jgi:type IV secretion system protein VirB4
VAETLYKNQAAAKRERTACRYLPYTVQVDEGTVRTRNHDLMRIFKIEGIAHESADDEDLNGWAEGLNILLRNISGPNVALWAHTVRRTEDHYPDADFAPGFARDLDAKYRQRLINGSRMLVNELYLTVIYRPSVNKSVGFLQKLGGMLSQPTLQQVIDQLADDLHKLEEVCQQVMHWLERYEPRLLTTYQHNGLTFSEPLEFLSFLINGSRHRIPLPHRAICDALLTSRPFFGREAIEQRGVSTSVISGFLAIKEYPTPTFPGLLNKLLSAPYEFVLTQSFTFMSKGAAVGQLTRTRDRMINAGDLAESQIGEINDALDDLMSNNFVYGAHHLSLQIKSESVKTLSDALADARNRLGDVGMVVAREDVAIEAAFWAAMPCNFDFRPRLSNITSRNFAGFASMHNYPTGSPTGNHWGEAVTLLKTASGAPYYFNFHRDDIGHTAIIGPTGSGKTVAQGFLISMMEKFAPTLIFFDKDRGAEIFIRAQRGNYLPLEDGQPTGFNPFQRPLTPRYEQFLRRLIKELVTTHNESYSVREEQEIAGAIQGVYKLDPNDRRIAQLRSFLDPTAANGISARLSKWCAGGALSWVFDNADDEIDFNKTRLNGFDITAFIDNPETRTPIIMYLFQRVDEVLDGRKGCIFIDEFWKPLSVSYFEDLAKNGLKTYRKLNWIFVTGTQSPADALRSPIAKTIIEQSLTKIFMPNPRADREDYIDGFKLSEREFELIRTLGEGSRRFLIRQGENSVVAELDLTGFGDELAVLSGNAKNINLVTEVIAAVGTDPDVWLPEFQRRRHEA